MYEVLLVCYLIVALALIGFVLLQQGKGADMGASFGAGGANTIFGSSGSGNFMTRTTAILATLFFGISLVIGGITAKSGETVDEFDTIEVPVVEQQTPTAENNEFSVPEENSNAPVVEQIAEDVANEAEQKKEEDKP